MKKTQLALGNDLAKQGHQQYEAAKNKINEALKVRSRTYLNLCKNEACYNLRRKASAYCEICSATN